MHVLRCAALCCAALHHRSARKHMAVLTHVPEEERVGLHSIKEEQGRLSKAGSFREGGSPRAASEAGEAGESVPAPAKAAAGDVVWVEVGGPEAAPAGLGQPAAAPPAAAGVVHDSAGSSPGAEQGQLAGSLAAAEAGPGPAVAGGDQQGQEQQPQLSRSTPVPAAAQPIGIITIEVRPAGGGIAQPGPRRHFAARALRPLCQPACCASEAHCASLTAPSARIRVPA